MWLARLTLSFMVVNFAALAAAATEPAELLKRAITNMEATYFNSLVVSELYFVEVVTDREQVRERKERRTLLHIGSAQSGEDLIFNSLRYYGVDGNEQFGAPESDIVRAHTKQNGNWWSTITTSSTRPQFRKIESENLTKEAYSKLVKHFAEDRIEVIAMPLLCFSSFMVQDVSLNRVKNIFHPHSPTPYEFHSGGVASEKTTGDWVSKSGKMLIHIGFSKDQDWLPVSYEVYERNPRTVYKKGESKGRLIYKTTTQWTKQFSKWCPKKIVMTMFPGDDLGTHREVTIDSVWRIGLDRNKITNLLESPSQEGEFADLLAKMTEELELSLKKSEK